jgi:hypothetical protein
LIRDSHLVRGFARVLAREWKRGWPAPVALFAIVQLTFGPLLWSDGLPKGMDLNASLIAGYDAENGSWSEVWDDSRAPGSPKHVGRFTTTEVALAWLTAATGDVALSVRLSVWALGAIAAFAMYFLALRLTGSRAGALAAGAIYIMGRSTGFQGGLPLAAGFAFAPLVFLALSDALVAPGRRAALLLGAALALFVTSTVPGFTYLVAMAAGVFVAAHVVAAVMTHGAGAARPLLGAGLTLVAAGAVAAALAAYFISGVVVSTLPLVRQSGGFELEELTRRTPSFVEAVALAPPAFGDDSAAMNAAAWAAAALGAVACISRPGARTLGLMFAFAGFAALASQADSATYRFLFGNLPFFSLVRGANKWLGVAQLGLALMVATAFAPHAGAALAGAGRAARWLARLGSRRLARAVAVCAAIAVAVFVTVHAGPVGRWRTPYDVPPGVAEPFEVIAGADGTSAFAVEPFLEKRLTGEPFISAIDFGRTLGPGLSGAPVFGGFRAGGIEINDTAGEMLAPFRTNLVFSASDVPLTTAPAALGGAPEEFSLSASVEYSGAGAASAIELLFETPARTGPLALRYSLASSQLQVLDGVVGAALASTVAGPQGAPAQGAFDLKVLRRNNEVSVWLGDTFALSETVPLPGPVTVSARAVAVRAVVRSVEVAAARTRSVAGDAVSLRILTLYGVRHFVVMPYATEAGRERVQGAPGLVPLASGTGWTVLENSYYEPGDFWAAQTYGLYAGGERATVNHLLLLPAVGDGRVPVVAAETAPRQPPESAAFLAVPGDAAGLARLTAAERDEVQARPGLPLVHVFDPAQSRSGAGGPYRLPGSLVADRTVELLPTSREFVFEAQVFPADRTILTQFTFRLSQVFGQGGTEVVVDLAQGTAEVVRVTGQSRQTVATGSMLPNASGAWLRLSLTGDALALRVDGQVAVAATVTTAATGGPLTLSPAAGGVWMKHIAASTGREGTRVTSTLARTGFQLEAAAAALPDLGRDHVVLFPDTDAVGLQSSSFREGPHRLVVGLLDAGTRGVVATVEQGGEARRLPIARAAGQLTGGDASFTWFASDVFDVGASGPVSILAAVQGLGAEIVAAVVVEARDSAGDPVGTLLSATERSRVPAVRHSPSRYSGVDARGAVLVSRQGYDKGWTLVTDAGTAIEPVAVYGTLNGYMLPTGGTGPSWETRFGPQAWFRTGWLVTAVALAALAAAGATWALMRLRSLARNQRPSATQATGK